MADLYIMCGPAGSGKSTWARTHVKTDKAKIISRDQIRFSLLAPGDEYFSREEEVKKVFWNKITTALGEGYDVFVDQTSLTRKSRKYLLNHVTGYEHANIIWIDVPAEQALAQNENRKGTHNYTYVPPKTIKEMYDEFQEPQLNEGFYRIFRYKNGDLTMKGATS